MGAIACVCFGILHFTSDRFPARIEKLPGKYLMNNSHALQSMNICMFHLQVSCTYNFDKREGEARAQRSRLHDNPAVRCIY
jgi:hypothetical protein